MQIVFVIDFVVFVQTRVFANRLLHGTEIRAVFHATVSVMVTRPSPVRLTTLGNGNYHGKIEFYTICVRYCLYFSYFFRPEIATGHYPFFHGVFPRSERRPAVAAALFVVATRHEVLGRQAVGERPVGRYAKPIRECRGHGYGLNKSYKLINVLRIQTSPSSSTDHFRLTK